MPIETHSWADRGYRRLGGLRIGSRVISPGQLAENLSKLAAYEATADGWIRRHGRRRNGYVEAAVDVLEAFDRHRPCSDNRLQFIDRHFASEWESADYPHFNVDMATLEKLVRQGAITDRGAQRAYRIIQATSLAGAKQLKPIFRDRVLPWFAKNCPDGHLIVLRYGDYLENASAAMRVMHAAVLLPSQKLSADSIAGIGPLKNWHMMSMTSMLPLFVNLFNFIFYPFVGGFCNREPTASEGFHRRRWLRVKHFRSRNLSDFSF